MIRPNRHSCTVGVCGVCVCGVGGWLEGVACEVCVVGSVVRGG